MCTWARVAVAVKSKIRRDLIALSSLLLEARFFCSERLCGCNAGRERCVGTVCEDRRRAESVRWPDASKKSQRMPAGTSVTRGAWTGVKSSQAVVKARDGPLLGWGKPPKHQGEARPRLNTCASRAGARRAARGDGKHLPRHKQRKRPVPALKGTPSKVRPTQATLRPKIQPIIF